jgi:uncharacterized membrane protein
MPGAREKKRFVVVLPVILLLVTLSLVAAQEAASEKRRFVGSAQIQAGRYEDFFLRVITHERVIFVQPGETKEFNMYVRRGTMEKVAHDVQVIDNDDNFELSVEPSIIPELQHFDQIRLQASLKAPADLQPGDYPLRINVKGKEFMEEVYPLDTIIRVGSRAYLFNYIWLGMAVLLAGIMQWRRINIKKLKK